MLYHLDIMIGDISDNNISDHDTIGDILRDQIILAVVIQNSGV